MSCQIPIEVAWQSSGHLDCQIFVLLFFHFVTPSFKSTNSALVENYIFEHLMADFLLPIFQSTPKKRTDLSSMIVVMSQIRIRPPRIQTDFGLAKKCLKDSAVAVENVRSDSRIPKADLGPLL